MQGELTDYLHSQVKDISLSSARNASQADPVSPEDILCHPSHMPDLVAHVVWLYCKRLGYVSGWMYNDKLIEQLGTSLRPWRLPFRQAFRLPKNKRKAAKAESSRPHDCSIEGRGRRP
ncbi:unnamed protein product [Prunus armeniaca]